MLAAGVTGAGIALPLLGATTADAADAPTWDRVAHCESGGLWSADTGNGYFGGLQMTQDMWESSGGTEFAPRPDQASRAQQIAVAERILKQQGPYAWPACGVKSDLAKEGPAPDVNPGRADASTPAPEHKPSSSPGTRDHDRSSHEPAPATSGSPSKTPSGSGSSESSGTSDTSDASKGKHRKPARDAQDTRDDRAARDAEDTGRSATDAQAPEKSSGKTPDAPKTDPAPSRSTDRSAEPSRTPHSPAPGGTSGANERPGAGRSADADTATGADAGAGTGKHRAQPPRSDAEHPSRGGAEARAHGPRAEDYTVRPGDNLSAIAQEHSVPGGWHRIYHDNKKVVGSDPNLIHPGQQLELKK
ncbi:transglycosylase family protein [Streptomyces sp. AV19]|uniref:transglycosylase family protein n=1 Tax=Streptomyces sp. AV19 TaxID=2793068 RepID=UPI0027DE0FFD|nr:transglycosylase family protein [Streptomyces sp. AV19]